MFFGWVSGYLVSIIALKLSQLTNGDFEIPNANASYYSKKKKRTLWEWEELLALFVILKKKKSNSYFTQRNHMPTQWRSHSLSLTLSLSLYTPNGLAGSTLPTQSPNPTRTSPASH
jgi:hypothetical protein